MDAPLDVAVLQILSAAEEREKQVVGLEEDLARRRRDLEHEHSSRLTEAEATVRRLQVAPPPPPPPTPPGTYSPPPHPPSSTSLVNPFSPETPALLPLLCQVHVADTLDTWRQA